MPDAKEAPLPIRLGFVRLLLFSVSFALIWTTGMSAADSCLHKPMPFSFFGTFVLAWQQLSVPQKIRLGQLQLALGCTIEQLSTAESLCYFLRKKVDEIKGSFLFNNEK
ncbi:hypothetical protein [Olivibacter domesticus]|uniref:hypothetical protein n=1 Tax=Olivibacter domesticus TaxID=407022 RepID=UPI000B89F09D|nr:hypothetical protein [Olivibacter domesticus]